MVPKRGRPIQLVSIKKEFKTGDFHAGPGRDDFSRKDGVSFKISGVSRLTTTGAIAVELRHSVVTGRGTEPTSPLTRGACDVSLPVYMHERTCSLSHWADTTPVAVPMLRRGEVAVPIP